jgi:hypothetical protein
VDQRPDLPSRFTHGQVSVEPSDLVRRTHRTLNRQKFIAVTSRQLSGPHGKLMQMPEKARVEESDTYPILVRSFEPVADLDDRLQCIFTVLSLPPLEELSAQGPASRAPRRA